MGALFSSGAPPEPESHGRISPVRVELYVVAAPEQGSFLRPRIVPTQIVEADAAADAPSSAANPYVVRGGRALFVTNQDTDGDSSLPDGTCSLMEVVRACGFKVEVRVNITSTDILTALKEQSEFEYAVGEAAIVVLSLCGSELGGRGDGGRRAELLTLQADDSPLRVDSIVELLSQSTTLAGKPKIIIVSSCRVKEPSQASGPLDTDDKSDSGFTSVSQGGSSTDLGAELPQSDFYTVHCSVSRALQTLHGQVFLKYLASSLADSLTESTSCVLEDVVMRAGRQMSRLGTITDQGIIPSRSSTTLDSIRLTRMVHVRYRTSVFDEHACTWCMFCALTSQAPVGVEARTGFSRPSITAHAVSETVHVSDSSCGCVPISALVIACRNENADDVAQNRAVAAWQRDN